MGIWLFGLCFLHVKGFFFGRKISTSNMLLKISKLSKVFLYQLDDLLLHNMWCSIKMLRPSSSGVLLGFCK